MVNQPHLDLKHIVDALKSKDAFCEVEFQRTKLYEIGPWEFQSFARQDLEDDSERGRINALSNAGILEVIFAFLANISVNRNAGMAISDDIKDIPNFIPK